MQPHKTAAAPETNPKAAATHKEDRMLESTLASSAGSISWRSAVVAWYAGGSQPSPTVMREARQHGIADHPPTSPRDRVRTLALTGFDIEDIVAAVPELNPVDIVDLVDDVPGHARSIIEAHLQGFTPIEIEQRVDISRPMVYHWLDRLGLKPHRRSRDELTARQRSQISRAYNAGEPMATIARRFNVSYDQVRYAIRKAAA